MQPSRHCNAIAGWYGLLIEAGGGFDSFADGVHEGLGSENLDAFAEAKKFLLKFIIQNDLHLEDAVAIFIYLYNYLAHVQGFGADVGSVERNQRISPLKKK